MPVDYILGSAVTPALIQLVGPRIGVDPARLRPIDVIGNVTQPLLLIAGTDDQYTRLDESRALFARATSPKELWEVHGAGHEDLHDYTPLEYERRVGDFLIAHLRPPAPASESLLGSAHDTLTTCRSEAADRRECK